MVMRRLCDRIFFRSSFFVALMATLDKAVVAEHHRTQSALYDVCRIELLINNRQQQQM